MDKFGTSNSTLPCVSENSQIVIPNTFLRLDGISKMASDIDMDSHNIVNIGTPTLTQHVTNKLYVDDKLEVIKWSLCRKKLKC